MRTNELGLPDSPDFTLGPWASADFADNRTGRYGRCWVAGDCRVYRLYRRDASRKLGRTISLRCRDDDPRRPRRARALDGLILGDMSRTEVCIGRAHLRPTAILL